MQVAYQLDKFQPALPMRGVTNFPCVGVCGLAISTRTPHAGSDSVFDKDGAYHRFQPALPMRGVTFQFFGVTAHLLNISTRTPHAGSDASRVDGAVGARLFQPALPMRGVTLAQTLK